MEEVLISSGDISKGYLILVNKEYPLKGAGVKEKNFHTPLLMAVPQTGLQYAMGANVKKEGLAKVGEEVYLENRTASMLMQLLDDIQARKKIAAVSGYRSFQEQERIYMDSLSENGKEFTEKFVALPGSSEHQTGLAIDLGEAKEVIDFLCPEFPYEGICQDFREKAASFGFVQRYEKEKEDITSIGHEPWHFRYVGYPHSKIMAEKHLSLEEYEEVIEKHPYGREPLVFTEGKQRVEISYLEMKEGEETSLSFPAETLYQISGNNKKGVIITQWQRR